MAFRVLAEGGTPEEARQAYEGFLRLHEVESHLGESLAMLQPLVPGGGLRAHEDAGGHTIARHVGKTDAELLARISNNPGISGASTFTTRASAETAVSEVIAANSSAVTNFVAGSGNQLVITGTTSVSGRFVAQGATNVVSVSTARVVLVRDSALQVGYRIKTAYPIP